MLRPFIGIGFLAWAGGALAEPVSIVSDDLKQLVSGSLVEIDTPLGTKIPIRFGNDGLVSGQALDLAPLLGSEKDRGRWWVDNDKLCSKWFRWFDAEVRCITVQQDGSRLYWRKTDGETGTATLIERGTPETPIAPAPSSTVVAEAKARPAAKPASDEIPLPERKPSRPTVFAAADAVGGGPGQYTAAADTSARPEPFDSDVAPEGASPRATEISLLEATAKPESPQSDVATMRFGGDGLLEASSRVGAAPAATPAPPVTSEDAKSGSSPTFSPVRKLPPVTQKVAAPLRLPAQEGHRAAKVRPPPKPDSGLVATASIRPVVLYRVRGVERDDVLNVRRGPSDQHDQVAAIPSSGRRVVITGPCEEVWCPIQYGRIKGWVNSLYLAEEAPQAASSSVVYTTKR